MFVGGGESNPSCRDVLVRYHSDVAALGYPTIYSPHTILVHGFTRLVANN